MVDDLHRKAPAGGQGEGAGGVAVQEIRGYDGVTRIPDVPEMLYPRRQYCDNLA